ncbi:MAG: stage II sporulation protein M [Defluviitaleaceae bacterium]|nr:stage II sporulation protein M [Defluviitaleaceae bacterium]
MKESLFTEKNEEIWKSLENFNARLKQYGGIKKAGAGVFREGALRENEVREFARLFRLTGFHLAYAKTHYPNSQTVSYLNRLVGISHNFFYVRERGSFGEIAEFFSHTVPQTVRETYKYWVLAAAVFTLGMMFAGFYVAGDSSRLAEVMPAGMSEGFVPGETPDLNDGVVTWDGSLMSAFFITNNTMVAFNTFALGVFAGIFSLLILFYNGVIVGGLFGFLHAEGADMLIAYSLILPHGVTELAAIFFAGGGGLMLGKGLLVPGEFTRAQSLVFHAKKAVKLIPLIVVLLVFAAFVEGFFTPLAISPWFKLIFAVLTGVALVAYCLKGSWKSQ